MTADHPAPPRPPAAAAPVAAPPAGAAPAGLAHPRFLLRLPYGVTSRSWTVRCSRGAM